MINFNDVNDPDNPFRADHPVGQLVRLPLRLIPPKAVIPILQGPGRGLKWIAGSYNHGCWLGSYEIEKQRLIMEEVHPGEVVYDLGAHVGYFTVIFARLVGEAGEVHAFEPFAESFLYLEQHVRLNRFRNVVLNPAGVGAESGTAWFKNSGSSAMVRRAEVGEHEVPIVGLLDYVLRQGHRPPDFIKMDIEGEESHLVPTIIEFVRSRGIRILISTHGVAITQALVRLFESYGYKVSAHQWSNREPEHRLDNATLLFARP